MLRLCPAKTKEILAESVLSNLTVFGLPHEFSLREKHQAIKDLHEINPISLFLTHCYIDNSVGHRMPLGALHSIHKRAGRAIQLMIPFSHRRERLHDLARRDNHFATRSLTKNLVTLKQNAQFSFLVTESVIEAFLCQILQCRVSEENAPKLYEVFKLSENQIECLTFLQHCIETMQRTLKFRQWSEHKDTEGHLHNQSQ